MENVMCGLVLLVLMYPFALLGKKTEVQVDEGCF